MRKEAGKESAKGTGGVRVVTGTAEDFFKRSLARARRLDRGAKRAAEIRLTFEDPCGSNARPFRRAYSRTPHRSRDAPPGLRSRACSQARPQSRWPRRENSGIVRIGKNPRAAESGPRSNEDRGASGRQVSIGSDDLRARHGAGAVDCARLRITAPSLTRFPAPSATSRFHSRRFTTASPKF